MVTLADLGDLMTHVYVVGAFSTCFGKRPHDTVKNLTSEAVLGAFGDAGIESPDFIESGWFGNCGMWAEAQGSIRGQVCLTPLVRMGRFPERVPVINVEGGCATASFAFNGAYKDIVSRTTDISIAIGVEKAYFPDAPERTTAIFNGGIDQYDREEWLDYYKAASRAIGQPFNPGDGRTIFMDTYAMQACYHMKQFGTTVHQIAFACSKNHAVAVHNPRAQYRRSMTVDDVLADRPVSWPLTRAMCAPVGDGAAAAVLASESALKRFPRHVRDRAVRVAATALSGGKYRRLDEPGLSRLAAQKAYRQAGIGPADVDIAEVHDATSFCEIYQAEMLGFCREGAGGPFVESGATALGGMIPINTSGGLVSKGHPVGATGLSMIYELVEQLRGESGARQVKNAEWALAENGGGVIGFDEAACSVVILHKSS
jgi:acetyl-CoA acetyltransferase